MILGLPTPPTCPITTSYLPPTCPLPASYLLPICLLPAPYLPPIHTIPTYSYQPTTLSPMMGFRTSLMLTFDGLAWLGKGKNWSHAAHLGFITDYMRICTTNLLHSRYWLEDKLQFLLIQEYPNEIVSKFLKLLLFLLTWHTKDRRCMCVCLYV